MTGITVTHLAAQEHINDLLREAEHSRRVADVRPPSRRVMLWSRRRFARRVLRPATA